MARVRIQTVLWGLVFSGRCATFGLLEDFVQKMGRLVRWKDCRRVFFALILY
jgi:hypothetical protein